MCITLSTINFILLNSVAPSTQLLMRWWLIVLPRFSAFHEVHKIAIDICDVSELKGEENPERGRKIVYSEKKFVKNVLRQFNMNKNFTPSLFLSLLFDIFFTSFRSENAKVPVIGKNVSWFLVIDSFLRLNGTKSRKNLLLEKK